jgi:hypothetical protein
MWNVISVSMFCWPCITVYQYSDWPCVTVYQYSDWPCVTVYQYSDWPCITVYQYSDWPCITVYHYSETNVMHFLFSLLRIKGLYMFRALLAHPQEALYKRHLVYCIRVMSVGCHSTPLQSWWQPTDITRTYAMYLVSFMYSLLRMSK